MIVYFKHFNSLAISCHFDQATSFFFCRRNIALVDESLVKR